jgi:hypothetical protein
MVASISLAHEGLLGNCNILLPGVRNFNVNGEAFTADLYFHVVGPRVDRMDSTSR